MLQSRVLSGNPVEVSPPRCGTPELACFFATLLKGMAQGATMSLADLSTDELTENLLVEFPPSEAPHAKLRDGNAEDQLLKRRLRNILRYQNTRMVRIYRITNVMWSNLYWLPVTSVMHMDSLSTPALTCSALPVTTP